MTKRIRAVLDTNIFVSAALSKNPSSPTREAVDGGRFPEPITDRQIAAFRELEKANIALGWDGKQLIDAILGKRKSFQEYGMSLGMTTAREFDFISRDFRKYLDTLAKLWGYA